MTAAAGLEIPDDENVIFFFEPQDFLLKNQILGVLIRHYAPELSVSFPAVPALTIYASMGNLQPGSGTDPPPFACVAQPFDRLLAELKDGGL